MKRSFPVFTAFGVLAIFLLIAVSSCKKMNLATELGQGLVPAVDNIHTFETSLDISSFNNIFPTANDSLGSLASDEQFLGVINNDPVFGKTEARMYFQLLSSGGFKNVRGKRYIDSVVLVLHYVETYGDTTLPQTIQVAEIAPGFDFKTVAYDTIYKPDYNFTTLDLVGKRTTAYPYSYSNFPTTNILGSKSVVPHVLNDSLKIINVHDTVGIANQLRIRLDNAFGQRLLSYDSATIANDTTLKTKINGFALQSAGAGNAIMGFTLGGNTQLAVYYRYDNLTTPGVMDTTVANFIVRNNSGTANYIKRDYSGTQITATANDAQADNLVYIQNTPGSFATLKIPALDTMSNKIIHLAELDVESIYDPQDTIFNAPGFLFLDQYNTATSRHQTLPYLFQYSPVQLSRDRTSYIFGISNFPAFYTRGTIGDGKTYFYKKDASGNTIKLWRFNLTRYVQNVVDDKVVHYDLRLFSLPDFNLADGTPGGTATINVKPFNFVAPGKGRVVLGGGNHPTQKMKLRIVYSKI